MVDKITIDDMCCFDKMTDEQKYKFVLSFPQRTIALIDYLMMQE